MRKAISLVVSAIMISSSVSPVFAQKRPASTRLANKIETTSVEETAGELAAVPTKQKPKGEVTRFGGFFAYTEGQGVLLTWQMEAEIGNIGFYAYRVGKGGPELVKTNKGIIQGAATHGREVPAYGQTYSFYDPNGTADSAYYLEALALDGSKVATGQIYPQYVPSLTSVTGSENLAARAESEPALLEDTVLTMTKELVTERETYNLLPDPVTHKTVISQPGVARIGVKGEGLVRVTRAQLDAAGFNTSTNSANWQLYLEGIQQAIIIGPNADYVEFYGKGTDTPETDIRKYFLLNGASAGKRIASRVAHGNTSTVVTPTYFQTFVKKERTVWLDDIINGDAENYFGRGFSSSFSTLNFNLSGIPSGSQTARISLRFQGYSATPHTIEASLNNQVLGTVDPNAADETNFTISFTVPVSLLLEGANNVKFRTTAPSGDFCFFDTLYIDFGRQFLADQNKLSFYTQNYRIAKLSGFTSANIRVFDMTNENEPILMTNLPVQPTGSTFGVNMPASRGRVFYAAEDSAFMAPESVTANNPDLVGVPENGAQMVIIAHKNFLPQAQTWANYRIAQGISVRVVDVDELFDEFTYGQFSSDAIRSFLQYATTTWNIHAQYALLIGDSSWDSRNYEGLGNFNYVPTKMVDTVYSDAASDDALADFNGDGLTELAIGRIPGRTGDQITTVYNKMLQWEALPIAQWNTRGAVFAYDFDSGYPFAQMSQTLRNQIPMVPATMVFRGEANANANIIAALSTGPYIANYSGHGTAGSWGGSPAFFNVQTVAPLADSNPTVYTMLTCLNGYFHWLYNPSMAEVLMFTPNKGAVVAWASSGLTTPDLQENMATRFYGKIAEGTIPRIGDLVRDAKTVLEPRSDVRFSWVLLGDPMLVVRELPAPGATKVEASPTTKGK